MTSTLPKSSSAEFAERGWRIETVVEPDGTMTTLQVPLTIEEFLHPQEGYYLPNSTFHDNARSNTRDILTRRYANDPATAVFSDLILKWDIPNLKDNCPDVCVVFGISNKEKNRTSLKVVKEGVRPSLIIEVVSPYYRKADREIKVKQYAQAKVQEYVIIDQRTQRGQLIDEVLGYRLVEGYYLPVSPDEDGRILCQTVGLWISLKDGQVVMHDAQTGERLLNSLELHQKATEAENRATQAENRATEAENRAAILAERLRAAGIDPDS